MNLGHWTTSLHIEEDIPFGFIYKITNNITQKKYIGKKQCKCFLKRPPLKGKKKRRIEEKETDRKSVV